MRGFFVTLHLGMLGGVLAYLDARSTAVSAPKPVAAWTPRVQPVPPAVRPAPSPPPAPSVASKVKQKAASSPPKAGSKIETKPISLAEARGTAIKEMPRKTPADRLGEKGLHQQSGKWLLTDAEDRAAQQLVKLNETYKAVGEVVTRLEAIRRMDTMAAQWEKERVAARLDVESLQILLDTEPRRGNNLIVANYQAIERSSANRRMELNQIKRHLADLYGQMPSAGDRRKLEADRGRFLAAFRSEVAKLRGLADPLAARYDELSQNHDVTEAIRESNDSGNGATLGPSDGFKTLMGGELAKAEKLASQN